MSSIDDFLRRHPTEIKRKKLREKAQHLAGFDPMTSSLKECVCVCSTLVLQCFKYARIRVELTWEPPRRSGPCRSRGRRSARRRTWAAGWSAPPKRRPAACSRRRKCPWCGLGCRSGCWRISSGRAGRWREMRLSIFTVFEKEVGNSLNHVLHDRCQTTNAKNQHAGN